MLKFIVDGKEISEDEAKKKSEEELTKLEDEIKEMHGQKNVEILIED